MNSEAGNPFSELINFSSSSNLKELREKVEHFKTFVKNSKISSHVVDDLLSFCTWMKERSNLELDIEEECIVPIIKFFLEDANQKVSKTAYSHLAIMINGGKISIASLENHFCGLLAKVLNDTFDDDFRLQTINTIFEIIYYVNKDIIVKEIMPEITKLYLNPSTDLTLKTACVSRLDKLASRLERDLTEKHIIPLYEKMANDKSKIRKNCVEVSVALSFICSKEVRESILVPIYITFLEHPLKFVSDLALIALGPFIASFANTEQNEHQQTLNEVLMNNIYNFNYGKINIDFNLANSGIVDEFGEYGEHWNDNYKRVCDIFLFQQQEKLNLSNPFIAGNNNSNKNMSDLLETSRSKDDVDLKDEFNTFNYWREPIMNIDDLIDADEKSSSELLEKNDDFFDEMEWRRSNRLSKRNEWNDSLYKEREQKEELLVSNIERCLKLLKDASVPKELMFYFLKNLLSSYGSNCYQADINCICAFSLPAVALTLGQENWPCLRPIFNLLVVGLSTNIRLILASSLHELAKIIGPFYSNRDLLPALFAFMDQSDDVRERILKNLSPLVNTFDKAQQKTILRKLPEFYKLDNEYNWRFRVEFINQFTKIVQLFDKPKQFSQIIIPMIFSLLEDRIAEVRKSAIPLLSLTIQHLNDLTKHIPPANKLKESILDQIYYKLYLSKKWSFRQLFIMVCDNIVQTVALPVETFEEKLLAPLLNLSNDKVNNVRLTLSRVLSNVLFQKYFEENGRSKIEETIKLLTDDQDKDVRSYFQPQPTSSPDQTRVKSPFACGMWAQTSMGYYSNDEIIELKGDKNEMQSDNDEDDHEAFSDEMNKFTDELLAKFSGGLINHEPEIGEKQSTIKEDSDEKIDEVKNEPVVENNVTIKTNQTENEQITNDQTDKKGADKKAITDKCPEINDLFTSREFLGYIADEMNK